MRAELTSRLHGFWYNFGWHKVAFLADAPLARTALFVSLIGYLLLFGDEIAKLISFDYVAESEVRLLSDVARPRMVYFGFLLLAAANLLFRWRSPGLLRYSRTAQDHVKFARENWTLMDVRDTFQRIEASSKGPLTAYYEATSDDLEKLLRQGGLPFYRINNNPLGFLDERSDQVIGRAAAIEENYDFFQHLVIEDFAQRTRRHKWEALTVWTMGVTAYILLAVPSLELLFRVMLDWMSPSRTM